jgi:hypothetical protein
MTPGRALIFLLFLALASGCVPTLQNLNVQAPNVGDAIGKVKSHIVDPVPKTNHIQLTQVAAEEAVVNRRLKPASVAAGKRVLSLQDCRSLALTNSIEIEQAFIEEFTQNALKQSNVGKMMPHFAFNGELSNRDNDAYSYSEVLGQEGSIPSPGTSGTGVNQYAVGRERPTWRYSLEARWSPTEAALAYYLAGSSNNDKLKQFYIRVRTAQRLVGAIDAAFARLLCLQHVTPMSERLLGLRQKVSGNLEDLLKRRLANPEDYHKARQKLIRSQRLFSAILNESEQQRNILASAMHLSPDSCIDGGFFLVGEIAVPNFRECVTDLEMTAIKNRPEAYKAGLDHINSVNDLKRTIVKYFPKVTTFWRYTRDRDKHLYNRDWKEIGGLVYFDLLDFWVNVWESKASRAITAKTYKEIGAVALGITSQVRTSAFKYYDGMDQLRASQESLNSSRMLLRIQREKEASEALQKLLLIESEADVLSEEIEVFRAIGEANAMLAELQSTTGVNYNEKCPE